MTSATDDFSDFIVYVDESGDHGLTTIDPSYPVFVLAFCIFDKAQYAGQIVPSVQNFKFKWFGHDIVLLHEHEIRKAKGDFAFLTKADKREPFLGDITTLIEDAPFTLIATVIHKQRLCDKYKTPHNPYRLGMQFCLERLYGFLEQMGQAHRVTWIVAERRGKNEDDALELEFRRICDGDNYKKERWPFRLALADKKVNSCGLQLADLLARPIGRWEINRKQPNRAFDSLGPKFFKSPGGLMMGFGLKVFP